MFIYEIPLKYLASHITKFRGTRIALNILEFSAKSGLTVVSYQSSWFYLYLRPERMPVWVSIFVWYMFFHLFLI